MNKLEEKIWAMKTADKRSVEELINLFVPITFRKGLIIGTPEHSYPILHFIEQGLVMGNCIIGDREIASRLLSSGFIPPIGGFLLNQNYPEFLHVLEETKAWYLNLVKAEALAQKNHHLYLMLMEIFEENMHRTRDWEMLLRTSNAYDRLLKFMDGNYLQHYTITNTNLAALLNINEKHLSKLKRRYIKAKRD